MCVIGMASGEVAGGDEAAGFYAVDLVERMLRRRRCRHDQNRFLFAWGHGLADLDQVRVAVEAEDLAACGSDVERSPHRCVQEGEGGASYGFDAGETVPDLRCELGVGGFVGLGRDEGDFDDVFLRDAGYASAGGLVVGSDVDGTDETEVDDIAGEDGVVAVA